MEPEEYEDLLDNEARVAEGEQMDGDPNCFDTRDRGREVGRINKLKVID